MNSIVNAMLKYDHRQHVLSDWLAELDQRFQLGEVGEDTNKIMWCQLLIGATGSSILSSLDEEATWEDVKESLLTRLGFGPVRDEAWAALKNLKKGSKDIVELAGEVEKLAKRLHPRDKEAAERHAVDSFLGALDRTLAAEVQKLGHRTMEDVVAAARRIKKILEEQTDTKMERLVNTMQDQIRILKKDLKEANEQIAAHKAAAPPVTAMAAVSAPTAATAAAIRLPPTHRSCSPHLPTLQRGATILPPSPPSDGSKTTELFPLRRRGPLCFQLPCPPGPPMPSLPESTRQRPRTASRTNTGAAVIKRTTPTPTPTCS